MGNTSITWHVVVNHCIIVTRNERRLTVMVATKGDLGDVYLRDEEIDDETFIPPVLLIRTDLVGALQSAEQYALEWLNAG